MLVRGGAAPPVCTKHVANELGSLSPRLAGVVTLSILWGGVNAIAARRGDKTRSEFGLPEACGTSFTQHAPTTDRTARSGAAQSVGGPTK